MTDQPPPAAPASGALSPEREAELRATCYGGPAFDMDLGDLLDEIDRLREQHDGDRRMLRLAINAQKMRAEQAERERDAARGEAQRLTAALDHIEVEELHQGCAGCWDVAAVIALAASTALYASHLREACIGLVMGDTAHQCWICLFTWPISDPERHDADCILAAPSPAPQEDHDGEP